MIKYITILLLIINVTSSLEIYRTSNLVPPDSSSRRKYYTSCKIGDGVISNIFQAKQYEGCSKVLENIILKVKDEKLLSQLYKSLKDVEIITGFLEISNSPIIKSLEFFTNLRKIEGQFLSQVNYSFIVYENTNLRTLFPRENVKIINGKMLIYSNPQLCPFLLNDLTNNTNFLDPELVNPFSNGNKIKCHTNFDFNIQTISLNNKGDNVSTFVTWNKLTDETLSSCRLYTLYYRKLNTSNQSEIIPWNEIQITEVFVEMSAIIPCLERDSNYSLYIKTETFDPDSKGQSDIITFTAGEPKVVNIQSKNIKIDPIDHIQSDYINPKNIYQSTTNCDKC